MDDKTNTDHDEWDSNDCPPANVHVYRKANPAIDESARGQRRQKCHALVLREPQHYQSYDELRVEQLICVGDLVDLVALHWQHVSFHVEVKSDAWQQW